MGTTSYPDLIMHPVRMRILHVLARRELTTRQIARELPDISQASVYRHARLLADAGLLRVVRELPVRGLVERVYAFDPNSTNLRISEMNSHPADFLRFFQIFVGALLDQYRLYSNHPDADPARDGVAFWGEVLYLTPQEHDAAIAVLREATKPWEVGEPSEGRLRFHVSRILIPDLLSSETNVPEDADSPKQTAPPKQTAKERP